MRLVRIAGADLNVFDFDYDLTWFCFFLNADGTVYGRYGGRDASDAHARLSLKGLRFALEQALEAHQNPPAPNPRPEPPRRAEDFAAAKRFRGGCIHCHNVKEFERADRKARGKWDRESIWVYPLPENVGITLDVDRGNLIKSVAADSPAAKAGMTSGDVLKKLNDHPVASFADASYGLHQAPARGTIPVVWLHDGKERSSQLEVAAGWRQTNITWRPSLLDLLPSLPFSGDDLKPEEKKKLGLPAKRLAFRQDKFVHSSLKAVGIQRDDVVVGLDGRPMDGTMDEFLGHVRRHFLVGDQITIDLLRDGKPVALPIVLK